MPWSKIAGLFVEVDGAPSEEEPKKDNGESTEAAAQPEQKQEAAAAPAPAAAVAPNPAASMPPPIIPAAVDEGMVEVLSGAIEAANLEGFDYIEFRDSLARMAKIPMSEQQKFQAVFATASATGLTKARLLESIDHYLGIIEGKKGEFGAHVEHMVATEITRREQAVAKTEEEIAALSEQIRQATAAIQEKQQAIVALKNEINEQNMTISQTSAKFESTYSFVAGKLNEDKGKISSYLTD